MNVMSDMMRAMPMAASMDTDAMTSCIESCDAAMQAATMCADACAGMDGMAACAGMCANMADVAMTTMRMIMRPNGMNVDAMTAMLAACVAMGEACAMECRSHADMHDHCRICAMACDAMVASCRAMMAAMA